MPANRAAATPRRGDSLVVLVASFALGGSLGVGIALVLGLVIGVTACGSSGHVNVGGSLDVDAALEPFGGVCSSPSACSSGFCLHLGPNAQGSSGLCSATCSSTSDCGGQGYCLPETVTADGGASTLDAGGACFHTCAAASDCMEGIPCIWQAKLDAGLCQTLTDQTTLCHGIGADAGTACESCLATSCCAQIAACVEDVPCAKLETCAGTCASSWQSSGIPTAEAVGTCATAKCPSCL
ncbi:MAG TPA: hypothetical protein VH044_16915 [Polyangiaceae bacterium]|jgi:hypothetical protein|nr:hypothetical protein [Polyangiaceae bacterium]